jgi:hypothetical protein
LENVFRFYSIVINGVDGLFQVFLSEF